MIEREYTSAPLQDLDFFSTGNVKTKALKAKARHQALNKERNRQYWWSDFIESMIAPYRVISFIACFAVMFQFDLLPAIIIGIFWGAVDVAFEQLFSRVKKKNRKRRSKLQHIYTVDPRRFDSFKVSSYQDDRLVAQTTETLSSEEIALLYRTHSDDMEEHEADLLLHRANHAIGCPKIEEAIYPPELTQGFGYMAFMNKVKKLQSR
ncbi:hypothetical protein [Paraburkholderia fungorum]|jgi:hypothetical protein|uniref:hypothetical protein n=1 Tax=Paraburkholderia fungorum TaxID=134537 RepID=UPI000D085614|nr:hypothetical protein [Paraburkholderia fungorum]PRZ45380.1 hypothetical protein BX589_13959 [Paraburkholderia fungorum]